MTQSIHIQHGLRNVARALRRRRRFRLALRAVWLALAVWSVGLLAGLFSLQVPPLVLLGVVVATLLLGLGYAVLSNPSLGTLARGLDFHYDLAEQLATADEVARRGTRTAVEGRLLEDSDDLLQQMQRYFRAQPLVPWREIETAVAVLLLAAGLTLATRPLLPAAQSPVALPELPVPAAPTETAREQPTEQPVEQQQPELSPQAQQAAEAIADALRDNGATRPAADALDNSDVGGAARELRELADQADQLSQDARSDLAESLRGAAEQLAGEQPELAEQLRRQADGIEQGGQEAAEALDDLARTVEELGQAPGQAAEAAPSGGQPGEQPGQGEGQAQQGQQGGQQAGQPGQGAGNQLGGEERGAQGDGAQAQGDTLPLPQASDAGGPTTEATGPKGPAIQLEAGGTGDGSNNSTNSGDSPLEGEADPNAIPAEYRDVVEEYFTPQP